MNPSSAGQSGANSGSNSRVSTPSHGVGFCSSREHSALPQRPLPERYSGTGGSRSGASSRGASTPIDGTQFGVRFISIFICFLIILFLYSSSFCENFSIALTFYAYFFTRYHIFIKLISRSFAQSGRRERRDSAQLAPSSRTPQHQSQQQPQQPPRPPARKSSSTLKSPHRLISPPAIPMCHACAQPHDPATSAHKYDYFAVCFRLSILLCYMIERSSEFYTTRDAKSIKNASFFKHYHVTNMFKTCK